MFYIVDSNKTIQQRLLTEDRPTPMSVYNWLSTYKEVAETIHLPLIYQPYGAEDPNMVISFLNEVFSKFRLIFRDYFSSSVSQ